MQEGSGQTSKGRRARWKASEVDGPLKKYMFKKFLSPV